MLNILEDQVAERIHENEVDERRLAGKPLELRAKVRAARGGHNLQDLKMPPAQIELKNAAYGNWDGKCKSQI